MYHCIIQKSSPGAILYKNKSFKYTIKIDLYHITITVWQLFILWCTNHLQIFKVLLMYTWQCLESILKLQPSAAEFNEKLMHICYEIRQKICTPITCEIEIIITPLLYLESDNDQILEMCCKKHVKTYFLTKTYCIFFLETQQLWWWFYHMIAIMIIIHPMV